MKKIVASSFLFLSLLNSAEIQNYELLNKSVIFKDDIYRVLRSFSKTKKDYFLVVNEDTLKTKIVEQDLFEKLKINKNRDTKYQILLDKYSKKPYILQNYGLNSLNSNKVYLSVDMCPSSKIGYENELFSSLASKNQNISLTIFISGKWIKTHEKEFFELIDYQKKSKLNIIWGNHTFTHFYDKSKRFEENFLLNSSVDIKNELIELEKLLLSYDLTPSIFFRFPGLVSDEKSVKFINSLGLIAIGSNAWLAKGESAKEGSVILIHGNKNEPKGIEIANELFKDKSLTFGNLLEDLSQKSLH